MEKNIKIGTRIWFKNEGDIQKVKEAGIEYLDGTITEPTDIAVIKKLHDEGLNVCAVDINFGRLESSYQKMGFNQIPDEFYTDLFEEISSKDKRFKPATPVYTNGFGSNRKRMEELINRFKPENPIAIENLPVSDWNARNDNSLIHPGEIIALPAQYGIKGLTGYLDLCHLLQTAIVTATNMGYFSEARETDQFIDMKRSPDGNPRRARIYEVDINKKAYDILLEGLDRIYRESPGDENNAETCSITYIPFTRSMHINNHYLVLDGLSKSLPDLKNGWEYSMLVEGRSEQGRYLGKKYANLFWSHTYLHNQEGDLFRDEEILKTILSKLCKDYTRLVECCKIGDEWINNHVYAIDTLIIETDDKTPAKLEREAEYLLHLL